MAFLRSVSAKREWSAQRTLHLGQVGSWKARTRWTTPLNPPLVRGEREEEVVRTADPTFCVGGLHSGPYILGKWDHGRLVPDGLPP